MVQALHPTHRFRSIIIPQRMFVPAAAAKCPGPRPVREAATIAIPSIVLFSINFLRFTLDNTGAAGESVSFSSTSLEIAATREVILLSTGSSFDDKSGFKR